MSRVQPISVWLLIAVCIAIEALLTLNDHGVLGPPRGRNLAYEVAAFWPGLLTNWQPNYAAQPVLMFISYSLVHGGLLHLGMNMITLGSLGLGVAARVGQWRFLAIYLGSAVGGALVYGLLSASGQPMVGASGALFGLAGAILAWIWEDEATLSSALVEVGRVLFLLVAINVIMYVALSGQLAWETHLGGFLAGWILGIAFHPDEDS
jgi:membrane associated rhomboid family serine protease